MTLGADVWFKAGIGTAIPLTMVVSSGVIAQLKPHPLFVILSWISEELSFTGSLGPRM